MKPFVTLQIISIEDKGDLRLMLDKYLEKLSEYGDFDISYPCFDLHWTENNRWPYWIVSNGIRIGFIFVSQISPFGHQLDHFLSEFYIVPNHRNQGLGKAAFKEILILHPGQWELAFFNTNKAADQFWSKLVEKIDHERKNHENLVILRFIS